MSSFGLLGGFLTWLTLNPVSNVAGVASTVSLLSAIVGNTSGVGVASSADLIRVRRLIPLAHPAISDPRRITFTLIVAQQIHASGVGRAISGSLVALVDVDTGESIRSVETRLALAIVSLLGLGVENALGVDVALVLLIARIRRLIRVVGCNEVGRREAHLAVRVRVRDKEAFSRESGFSC